jgi:hypothetical protein
MKGWKAAGFARLSLIGVGFVLFIPFGGKIPFERLAWLCKIIKMEA